MLKASTDEPAQAFSKARPGPEALKLTSGSLLARNTFWNLAGQVAPLLAGLIAIPRLIHGLGTDRFAIVTIAWIVVGYFSFFDLGLGRAMTTMVAQKLATDRHHELPAIIWTANGLMGALGILGGVVLALLSPVLIRDLLKTPASLQTETIRAFDLLGLSVPFVISTAGIRGILEARQKFGLINLARAPMGVATFAAPLLVIPWTANLTAMVGTLVAVRIVFWGAYAFLALREMPSLLQTIEIDWRLLPMLLSFGLWMTVSNLVSPVMAYLDRFFVGMLLSLTAVAYYATPFEVVTKLLVVPGAVVSVLFPAFSTVLVGDRSRAGLLFRRAVKYVIVILFPIVLAIVLFARNALSLWLGPDFALHSTPVLQWLAVGVFVNSLSTIAFALVQGAGRADITGKLHLLELPLYLASVWLLTRHFGIRGTAIAWTIRVIVDGVLLFWVADRLLDRSLRLDVVMGSVTAILSVFAVAMTEMNLAIKLVGYLLVLAFFFAITWLVLLINERQLWARSRERLLLHTPDTADI